MIVEFETSLDSSEILVSDTQLCVCYHVHALNRFWGNSSTIWVVANGFRLSLSNTHSCFHNRVDAKILIAVLCWFGSDVVEEISYSCGF